MMPSLRKTKTKRIAMTAVFLSACLIVSYIENMFIPSPFPGVKLGLSNVFIMFLFFCVGKTEAVVTAALRVLLAAILFGNGVSLFLSFLGTVSSLIALYISGFLKDKISYLGASVLSASFHGIGEITGAVIIYRSYTLISYLPVMLSASVPLGIISGGVLILLTRKVAVLLEK